MNGTIGTMDVSSKVRPTPRHSKIPSPKGTKERLPRWAVAVPKLHKQTLTGTAAPHGKAYTWTILSGCPGWGTLRSEGYCLGHPLHGLGRYLENGLNWTNSLTHRKAV